MIQPCRNMLKKWSVPIIFVLCVFTQCAIQCMYTFTVLTLEYLIWHSVDELARCRDLATTAVDVLWARQGHSVTEVSSQTLLTSYNIASKML